MNPMKNKACDLVALLPQKLHRRRLASAEMAWTGPSRVSALRPEAITASADSTHAWQM
jgi:hypothetical protein